MIATTSQFDTEKFVRLRRRRDTAQEAVRAAAEAHRLTIGERQRLEALQHEHESRGEWTWKTVGRRSTPTGILEDQERVRVEPAGLSRDLERVRREEADAKERLAEAKEELEPLARLVPRLEAFLASQGVDVDRLPVAAKRAPRPSGPAPSLDELEDVRSRIRELARERRQLEKAPPSKDDAFAEVDARIGQLASRYQPGRRIAFDDFGAASYRADLEHLWATFARANASQLRKLWREDAERTAKERGGWGLPAAERDKKLAELSRKLFDAELEEEAILSRLEAHGMSVQRRADCDPRAVLALPELEPAA